MRPLALVVPVVLATPALAQRILHTATLPSQHTVRQLQPLGDTDGDGRGDFVARLDDNTLGNPVARVQIVSGADGVVLRTLPAAQVVAALDVAGIADVNADGRADVAVANGALRAWNGSTGTLLWNLPQPAGETYVSVCGIGLFDADAVPDVAAVAWTNSSQLIVRVFRGQNGALITALPPLATQGSNLATLRSLGDQSGDGKQDFALAAEVHTLWALRSDTGAVLWSVVPTIYEPLRTIETMDLDGDGRREVVYMRGNQTVGNGTLGTAAVYGSNGTLRFTVGAVWGYETGVRPAATAVGDLDLDGFVDFAQAHYATTGAVKVCSGRTGAELWELRGTSPFYLGGGLAGLGDVDGDGHGDLVIASNGMSPTFPERWQIVSGKVLAEAQPQGGACGAGPFFPRLGASRPVLGQTLTISGLDGPSNVGGVLVWSLRPVYPTPLGASSCAALFDLGSGQLLSPLTQPQWTLALPLPLVPQFAGLEIALQSWYAPTGGPLGYDLGNGVWARLGWQ